MDRLDLAPWLDNLSFNWGPYMSKGEKIFFSKKEYIFYEEEEPRNVYIILDGRVRLFAHSFEGKEITTMIIGENGLLGEQFLFTQRKHLTNAVAVTEATLLKIDKIEFKNISLANKTMFKQCFDILSTKIEILTYYSINMPVSNSKKRIALTLSQLANIYGSKTDNGYVKINIPFTHQELADVVNLSRVTVSKEMNKLKKSMIVTKKRNYYYIMDFGRLKEYS